MGGLWFAIIAFICVAVYFLPTVVARDRRHRSIGGIFVINLFLGWTFIGWVVALAWAANSNIEPKPDLPSL
jgi:uncharacterized membrane protein YwaF